jgi:DNA-binding transcriptional regulator YdaS (Cro superfamily)
MTFKLRPKALFKFLRRLRRKSPPNLSQFGLAVREVIAVRVSRAMTGELSAAEARRMVMEKQLAFIRAHLAYTESILNGKAASALGAYFDVYQRAVESNRKRLRNRRWRWLRLR